jgi:hypothetical protein
MKKSVVIIGKGPSVLNSTEEFVNCFDEVAICNFPPIDGYEKYIGTRATHHFLNIHDPNPYKRETLNGLGLEMMLNTHPEPHDGFEECFPDNPVSYLNNYGEMTIPAFKTEYGFDPSCGIMAFEFFVTSSRYSIIGLVGFDFFKVGERGYFFPVEDTQQSHRYLYRDDGSQPFNTKGVRVQENAHDSAKSENFVHSMAKEYDKELIIK